MTVIMTADMYRGLIDCFFSFASGLDLGLGLELLASASASSIGRFWPHLASLDPDHPDAANYFFAAMKIALKMTHPFSNTTISTNIR